jgi:hypothetical protein
MLAEKVPITQIAKQFGLSRNAIAAFRDKFMGSFATVAAERVDILTANLEKQRDIQADLRNAESVWSHLKRMTEQAWKMLAACDEYLQDPENPEKYDLGPRGVDITVVMFENDDEGRPRKSKAKLSELIDEIRGTGRAVSEVKYSIADPRMLLLKTQETLTKNLELIARLQGELTEVTINITQTAEWKEIQQTILQVTADHPEVREALANALTGDA